MTRFMFLGLFSIITLVCTGGCLDEEIYPLTTPYFSHVSTYPSFVATNETFYVNFIVDNPLDITFCGRISTGLIAGEYKRVCVPSHESMPFQMKVDVDKRVGVKHSLIYLMDQNQNRVLDVGEFVVNVFENYDECGIDQPMITITYTDII